MYMIFYSFQLTVCILQKRELHIVWHPICFPAIRSIGSEIISILQQQKYKELGLVVQFSIYCLQDDNMMFSSKANIKLSISKEKNPLKYVPICIHQNTRK